MKKLLLALAVVVSVATAGVATASAAPYKLPASYRAVYCYPSGTYWQKQIAAFPAYYAQNNATFTAKYGANTMYCPVN